jgi:predicted AlkP superfamily pyrophosphatase or phosphodiesterase
VPHLDYALQRHGPESKPAHEATATIARHITALKESAARDGYETIFYGDYAIEPVTSGACFPNRALAAAGLLETREIRGMQYPDFHASRAFAIADHAVAHVHVGNPQDLEDARAILESLPGVDLVLDPAAQTAFGLAHVRSGELVLVAKPGAWFAYPWWQAREQAPDFATHVDIHNKPGYDPCELFFGWPPLSVSMDTDRVKGTHGRLCEVAWDTSLDLGEPADHVALGAAIRNWLQRS